MPNEDKIRYKVGEKIYNIPSAEKDAFLTDFKDAVEVKGYSVGDKKYNIPVDQVSDFLKDMPDAKALDFEMPKPIDTGQPADLGKPVTAPEPGVGGGLPSDGTPGKEGGPSQFSLKGVAKYIDNKASIDDIKKILKEVGIDSLPSEEDIEIVGKKEGKGLKTITDESGKPIKLEVTGEEEKIIQPELIPTEQEGLPAKRELPVSMEQALQKGDINAMMPEIGKIDVAKEELKPEAFKTLIYSGENIYNPWANIKKNIETINKEEDADQKSYEYAKIYNDIIEYNNALITDSDLGANIIQQKAKIDADQLSQIQQQLQIPDLPQDQKNQLQNIGDQLTANLLGAESELERIEEKKARLIESNNKLNGYKNLLDYNLDNGKTFLGSIYNGFVASSLKGINNLFKWGNSLKYDILGKLAPVITDGKISEEDYDKIKQTLKDADFNTIATDFLDKNINKLTVKFDEKYIERNPGLQKGIFENLNSANGAQFIGGLFGSLLTTMTTGGQGIAVQVFGSSYDELKKEGLDDSVAGLAAIPIAVVSGLLAPYGTETVLKKLATSTGKQQLLTAIKNIGTKDPSKIMTIASDYAKKIFQGTGEEFAEDFIGGLTEASTRKITEMFTGVDLSKDSFFQTLSKSFKQGAEGGAGGLVLQVLLAPIAGFKYGNIANIATDAIVDPKKDKQFLNNIDNLYRSAQISQQQYDNVMNIYNKSKAAVKQIPPNVKNPQAISRAVQLIVNQEEIEKQLETTNPAMRGDLEKQLKDINKELGSIASGKVPAEVERVTAPPAVSPTPEPAPIEPAPTEAAPVEEVKAEVTVAEPLKDVPNTTDALNKKKTELGESSDTWQSVADLVPEGSYGIVDGIDTGKTISDVISETYHADKAAGKATELTKAVEELLTKPVEAAVAPEAAPTEAASQPTLEDFDVINIKSVKGRKAREELKARVGEAAYKKMDMVNKKFEETINDLEKKGILRKECP